MIVSGTLNSADAEPTRQWRAAAAVDADRAATTQAQFVDATRRDGVRESLRFLRGAHRFENYPAADRRAHVLQLLATSVEKQARVSGLGRIHIPVRGAA